MRAQPTVLVGETYAGAVFTGEVHLTRITRLTLGVVLAIAPLASAADVYVNHEAGDDKAAGSQDKPLRTIHVAIKAAKAGDTVHLAPTTRPYRESVELLNRAGEEGKPITVDGHGATIYGAEPLNESQWKQVSPGLWRSDELYKSVRMDDAVIVRYFFLFNGRMERMGRTSKGAKQPFKKPEELKAGEWTFAEDQKAFYVKVEAGIPLAEAHVEAPVRSSGVIISGKNCEHLVVRNITSTHVYNDGFNIHGHCRDVLFQDVRAIECGDDGISAHDDCHIKLDGFLSFGNSTGICHVGQSESESDHVVIAGCHGFGFFVTNGGKHVLRNAYIDAAVPQPVAVSGTAAAGGKAAETCRAELENVLVYAAPGVKQGGVRIGVGGDLVARRVTTVDLDWVIQGKADVRDSVIVGHRTRGIDVRARAAWTADRNVYSLRHIRMDQTFYTTGVLFADYAKATGQDRASRWVMPVDRGAAPSVPYDRDGKPVGADASLAPAPGVIPVSSERLTPDSK